MKNDIGRIWMIENGDRMGFYSRGKIREQSIRRSMKNEISMLYERNL